MNFFASFKDKRLRYGTLSTVMILFSAAIFVFVNLVADQLNVSTDLTGNQMYTLSEYSIEYLTEELTQDINIYALVPTGQESADMIVAQQTQMLEEYAAASSHINVEYRDPNLYPTFVEQFAEPDTPVEAYSIIVQCGDRHRIIAPSEMYTTELDYNTFQENITSINIEPQISKAIHYVTLTDSPVVYQVTGSGEYEMQQAFIDYLSLENYEFKTVDLVLNEVPEDCDILLVTAPQRDWSLQEAERIEEYLTYNGNAVFILGFSRTRFANIDGLLSGYGVALGDYIVIEGDPERTSGAMPTLLIPEIAENEMTQAITDMGYPSVLIQATGIDRLELARSTTDYEPLLVTSASAYGKRNPESSTVNKEPGDLEGPFNLGMNITDSLYTDTTYYTNLTLFTSESILDETVNYTYSGGTNWDILVSCFNSMAGAPESIYIPAKQPTQITPIMITQLDANILMFVALVFIPLVFVAAGAFVWFRRRHN